MKKALGAGILLFLMLIGAIVNTRYLDGLTEAMIEEAEISRGRCAVGDPDGAEAHILNTAGIWAGAEGYVSVFLRQSEEDRIEECLWAVRECLRAGETDRAEIVIRELENRLLAMAAMEHVSRASIF